MPGPRARPAQARRSAGPGRVSATCHSYGHKTRARPRSRASAHVHAIFDARPSAATHLRGSARRFGSPTAGRALSNASVGGIWRKPRRSGGAPGCDPAGPAHSPASATPRGPRGESPKTLPAPRVTAAWAHRPQAASHAATRIDAASATKRSIVTCRPRDRPRLSHAPATYQPRLSHAPASTHATTPHATIERPFDIDTCARPVDKPRLPGGQPATRPWTIRPERGRTGPERGLSVDDRDDRETTTCSARPPERTTTSCVFGLDDANRQAYRSWGRLTHRDAHDQLPPARIRRSGVGPQDHSASTTTAETRQLPLLPRSDGTEERDAMARGNASTAPVDRPEDQRPARPRRASKTEGRHAGPWGASFDGTEPDGKTTATGLTFERRWTRPGIHPYDEITWEYRTAGIANETRQVASSSRRTSRSPTSGASSPPTSSSASTSAATSARPERETSVRQLIDRVVNTIAAWAETQHYFATDEDLADLQGRADPPDRPPEDGVQLAGLVQRRHRGAAAVLGLLHQLGPGHDVLDHGPRQDRGHALQVRLRRRQQPLHHPLAPREKMAGGGTASGPVSLHEGLRRLRRRREVGRQDPARGQDGHPRRRPPGRPRVHRFEGARGAEGLGAHRGRLRPLLHR